jgi:hypothetical protein
MAETFGVYIQIFMVFGTIFACFFSFILGILLND